MEEKKLINILVNKKEHDEFKNLLRKRKKGERVKYLLGDNANAYMNRSLGQSNRGKANEV